MLTPIRLLTPAAASLALSLALTPLVRAAARRLGAVARPKGDRWHSRPTALMGGVAIFASVALACGALVAQSLQTAVALGCAAFLFLVGLADDVYPLKPYQKLVGQLMGAMPVIYCGMTLPWTGSPAVDVAVTVLWLVGITNAVNLLDNMDGLAAGVGAIAAGTLGVNFAAKGDVAGAQTMAALAAALVGFLTYNWNPASVFMGDCGSLFIGFFLAASALVNPAGGRSRSFLPVLAVPVLTLFIPIFDTVLVTVLRKLAGRPAARGGRDHASHRLVALGLSERRAVGLLYALAAASGVLGLLARGLQLDVSLALIAGFTLGLTLLGVHLAGVKVYAEDEARAAGETPLVSFLVDLSYKRRVFEVMLDLLLIVLSYYTAHALVFGPVDAGARRELFFQTVPVLVAVKITVFLGAGVYRGLWRYVSLDSLVVFTRAVVVASVLSVLALVLAFRFDGYSRAVFVLDGLLLLFLLTGSRTAFRLFRRLLPAPPADRARCPRVLIYGAGDAGDLLVREMLNNPSLAYAPVGFVDDDPRKKGKAVHGLRVFGGGAALGEVLRREAVDEVWISTALIPEGRVARIVRDCTEAAVPLRRLRISLEDLVDPAAGGGPGAAGRPSPRGVVSALAPRAGGVA